MRLEDKNITATTYNILMYQGFSKDNDHYFYKFTTNDYKWSHF